MIKLLGEQLIRNDIIAVLELVKNGYDADADTCTVRVISGLKSTGFIEIEDNGSGMTLDIILGSWMEPATDAKIRRKVSPKGRRVQGEKGVGRFAADKIGRSLVLTSRPRGSADEVEVRVDWDAFEAPSNYLHDVKVPWVRRPTTLIKRSGTVLHIERLRSQWDEDMILRLKAGLGRLVLGLAAKDEFALVLESDDYPADSGPILPRSPPAPHYYAKAVVDPKGKLKIWVGGKARVPDAKTPEFTKCGPFGMEISAWDLDESLLKSVPDLSIVKARALIRSWSGISVYLDGFRVYPYGELGDDWLELDRRRLSSPWARFSNSQLMGTIHLTKDGNPEMRPQTNREGLIQNAGFEELRSAALRVISELENFKIERSQRETKEPTGRRIALDRTHLVDLKSYVESSKKLERTQLMGFIHEAFVATDKSEEFVLREIARYRRLATLGMLASVLVHEVGQQVDSISRTSSTQRALLERGMVVDRDLLRRSFERIETAAEVLSKTVSMWQPFIRARARPEDVDIREVVRSAVDARRREIDGNDIDAKILPEPGTPLKIKADPADILQIASNLLDNSLYWLKDIPKPKIRITLSERHDSIEILFSDNGPGIPDQNSDFIFLPFWTTKPNGSGLGLTIVGETVSDLGGTISLVESELGKGASFRIRIPIQET
jgi:signal transduction histidine kinase